MRFEDDERELTMMRWGMPEPGAVGERPVANNRNTSTPHWRRWLGPGCRCLVPATSFCEYEDTKPRKTPVWFALDESRPLSVFAGMWCTWRSTKAEPVEGEHQLFPDDGGERRGEADPPEGDARGDGRLDARAVDEAKALKRPLPDGTLQIVARGERKDEAPKIGA